VVLTYISFSDLARRAEKFLNEQMQELQAGAEPFPPIDMLLEKIAFVIDFYAKIGLRDNVMTEMAPSMDPATPSKSAPAPSCTAPATPDKAASEPAATAPATPAKPAATAPTTPAKKRQAAAARRAAPTTPPKTPPPTAREKHMAGQSSFLAKPSTGNASTNHPSGSDLAGMIYIFTL
jgi:hypothetical protein